MFIVLSFVNTVILVVIANNFLEVKTDENLFQTNKNMPLVIHQKLLQDDIRLNTYLKAIMSNIDDFNDKVVLDVGAGTGILSYFAVMAGARKVYSVEGSTYMVKHEENLINNNKLNDRIQVINGEFEEITLPEKVDVIITETMGYLLFYERILDIYFNAKKWLKPNGKLYPSYADLYIAPFSDPELYNEKITKANFWSQKSFHGLDISSLRGAALKEYLGEPDFSSIDINILTAKPYKYGVNFTKVEEKDLQTIDIPINYVFDKSAEVHGLAFWFDVAFIGSQTTVWLSTSPTQPDTTWHQVRCFVDTPLFVKNEQKLSGRVVFKEIEGMNYELEIELGVVGSTELSTNSFVSEWFYQG